MGRQGLLAPPHLCLHNITPGMVVKLFGKSENCITLTIHHEIHVTLISDRYCLQLQILCKNILTSTFKGIGEIRESWKTVTDDTFLY